MYMISTGRRMATLLVGGLLAFSAVSAKAGTIFTDQALFNAAVSGLTLAGTENFDALPTGPVASGAAFMGGQIELSASDPSVTATTIVASAPNEWRTGFATTTVSLTGAGGGSTGFSAISFAQRPFAGSWTLTTTAGANTVTQLFSSFIYRFLGWVGTPGETLLSASFDNRVVALDDIQGYQAADTQAVSEPGILALFVLWLAGIGFARRKQAA
jgi:hypothetical protein